MTTEPIPMSFGERDAIEHAKELGYVWPGDLRVVVTRYEYTTARGRRIIIQHGYHETNELAARAHVRRVMREWNRRARTRRDEVFEVKVHKLLNGTTGEVWTSAGHSEGS